MTDEITGVILAAGRGTRIFPFNTSHPKPILPILGRPVLEHQIEMMKAVGVRRVLIVIGHLGYHIVRTLGNGAALGVQIEYVEQTEILGIAHAVGRLEPYIEGPFLLCLGDIFFITDRLQTMLDELGRDSTKAVLASKLEPRPEMIRRNFAILTDEGNVVRRVIEKPRYTQSQLKGCGIYLFTPETFDAIRRTPRTAMRDEYEITDAIQIMIDDGHRVVHSQIIDDDLNLTVPEDVLHINMSELRRRGLPNYFCDPDQDAAGLSNCVVGRDVTIGRDVVLDSCVVFDGCMIADGTVLSHAIVTPDRVIHATGDER